MFNVVAAMEILGQHVQCGLCHRNLKSSLLSTYLSSFHFDLVAGVIFTIRDIVEAEGLTV